MNNLTDKQVFMDLDEFELLLGSMKATLGLSDDADKDDVLAEVRRLNKVLTDYEAEQKVVMAAYGYDTWEELMESGAAVRAGVIMEMGR